MAFPFGSDRRRNLEKKLGDWDGEGVVRLRELVDTWDDVEDPDISLILAPDSLLCVQTNSSLIDNTHESTQQKGVLLL